MDEDQSASDIRTLTAEIVASYVTSNSLRSADLPELIGSVYSALSGLNASPTSAAAPPLERPVSVKKSVHNDYLISMEDGKRYQSLKRHLRGRGLTPAEYLAKWDLPSGYPMIAPGYSERRSTLARSIILVRRRADTTTMEPTEPQAPEIEKPERAADKPKRGRKQAEAVERTN